MIFGMTFPSRSDLEGVVVRLLWAMILGWLAVSSAAVAAAPAVHGPAFTTSDLETYLDGLIPYAIRKDDVAGAEVVVVQGDRVLFSKGYGLADVASGVSISPDRTLFRLGSISKLFTWTAVMQQVERGKLDLDQDVNTYLDFRIPPRFGRPITLRDLLTHTSGFEEVSKGLLLYEPHRTKPLGEYLRTHVPARIFPAGKVTAYSNYGAALAAYIVERASGVPFERYVEQNIFTPLGMTHSSFWQPLPRALRSQLASGYSIASSRQPGPFEIIQVAPAGALSSTGADMARFMIAHLNDGRIGDFQLLRPETVKLMHASQHVEAAGVNGMAFGFYEMSYKGRRVISHGGDTTQFHGDLYLLPSERIGIFMAFNSRGTGGGATDALSIAMFHALMDRYFPSQARALPTWSSAAADARRVAGRYLVSRREESNFRRLRNLSDAVVFRADPDGTITTDALPGLDGRPIRWREIGPLVYQEQDGSARLAFVRDRAGRIDHAATDADLPVYVFQPVGWSEDPAWIKPFLHVLQTILWAGVLLWPGAAMLRRFSIFDLDGSRGPAWSFFAVRAGCALDLMLLHVWQKLARIPSVSAVWSNALDLRLGLLYLVGWVGVLIAIAAAYRAAASLRDRDAGIARKLIDIVLALALLGCAWVLFDFHLLDFKFRY